MVTETGMTRAAPEHVTTSRELLAKAQEALDQDDLLQASEKGWGAAAHMVKGVAEKGAGRTTANGSFTRL